MHNLRGMASVLLFKFYVGNYKTLLDDVKEDLSKWRDTEFIDWKTQYSRDDKINL